MVNEDLGSKSGKNIRTVIREVIPALLVFVVIITILTAHYWNQHPPTNINLDLGFPLPFLFSKQSLLGALATQQFAHLETPLFFLDSNLTETIPKALSLVVHNPETTIKIVQVLQLFVGYFSVFLLLKTMRLRNSASIVGSATYITTPFLIQALNGASSIIWAYMVFPLAMAAIVHAAKKMSWQWSVLAGIAIALATTISMIQFIYYTGIAILFFAIVVVALSTRTKKDLVKTLKHTAIVLLSAIAASLFIIVPTIRHDSPYSRYESEIEYRNTPFVKNFYAPTFYEIVAMQNKEWIRSEEIGIAFKNLPAAGRMLPVATTLIALIGYLATWKKNSTTSKILLLAGLGTLYFALPFYSGESHIALSNVLPGFSTIRTPGRFLIPTLLTIACGSGLLVDAIPQRRTAVRNGIVIALLILTIASAQQTATSYNTFTTRPVEELYPDYHVIQSELARRNTEQDYRVLDLTTSNIMGSLHHTKYYTLGHPTLHNTYELYQRFGKQKYFGKLLANINIRYIVTNSTDNTTESSGSITLQDTKRVLESQDDITRVFESEHGVSIWEIKDPQPPRTQVKMVSYVGDLVGYTQLLQTLTIPFAVTPLDIDNPEPVTIIAAPDYKETLTLNHFPETVTSFTKDAIYGPSVRAIGNVDSYGTPTTNTTSSSATTKNTINNSRLYADTVLRASEPVTVTIHTDAWKPSVLLIRAQSDENKLLVRHGNSITNVKLNPTGRAEWTVIEIESGTTDIRIETRGTDTLLDSYAIIPKAEWGGAYSETVNKLSTLKTSLHTIAEETVQIPFPKEGEKNTVTHKAIQVVSEKAFSLEDDIRTRARYEDFNARTLATPTTPNKQQANFFTTFGSPKHNNIASTAANTASAAMFTIGIFAIASLWKKQRSQ